MDIVEELRHNPEKGAQRLVAEYKTGLMSLARRFCVNESDAEELVNSTFATVVDNIDDYVEQSAFFAWMCQILTSKFSRTIRRKAAKLETYPGVIPDMEDEDAQEAIYRNLDASLLRDAIETLPADIKKTLLLHYFMDMPVKEIARVLSSPTSTITWRLHYARRILAAKLGIAAGKAKKAAGKPGGKALLLALALCGLTALGAAGVAAIRAATNAQCTMHNAHCASPDGRGSERAASGETGGTGETSGYGGFSPVAPISTPVSPDSPVPDVPFVPEVPSSFSSGEQTMNATARSFLVAAATFAATPFAASMAAGLPTLDSSQFDYKYEMLERPDQQDLDGGGANDFTGWSAAFSLGTTQEVGTIKIDASSNGKYLISNQAVGTAGDGWRSLGASSSTGFTVETRLKITDCTGANGAICVEAGPSDSKVYARLNFFADSIGWNGTTLTNIDTSAYHTYRIAREGGTATHSVWVDGVLVAENLGTGFTYNNSTLYRCLLGSPGSGWTGKADVAYLRFHKGAYAPISPEDKSRCKASTDFPKLYEMGADDTRFADSGNAKTSGTEWTASVGAAPTVTLNGLLSMNPNGKNTAYWATKDGIWKNVVTPGTPYTVDFRAKINSCNIDGIDRTLNFMTGTTGPVGSLYVGTNSVSWQVDGSMGHNITLDTNDNTDAMHIFRVAYSGGGRHAFTIWRDGVKIGEDLVDCTNFYAYQNGSALAIVRFGVVSTSTHGGAFDIDYIRWDTTGAYDWKDPPKAFTITVR